MKKILIVDDESDICLTLANVLEDRFVVHTFDDPLLAFRSYISIFEELWKNGINAVDRLKDIEAGAALADIKVIKSSSRAEN